MGNMRFAGPIPHPSFHPVALKVFPALPIVTVLSHIPGSDAVNGGSILQQNVD